MLTESDLRDVLPKEKKYRLSCGAGLYLEIHPKGYKYFVWAYKFPSGAKNKTWYQIGPYGRGVGAFTLKKARDERDRLDVQRRQGKDPRALKSQVKQPLTGYSFADVATEWIEWKDKSNAASTQKNYRRQLIQINAKFGKRLIATITRPECIQFKETYKAPEESNRIFALMKQVFDYYIDRIDDNKNLITNPCKSSRNTKAPHFTKSHPFLTWKEVPQFLKDLSENKCNGQSLTNACAKFHLLTIVRAGEGVAAEWKEIDWDKRLWTIPASKMKAIRERKTKHLPHLVPLSNAAVLLLEKIQLETGDCDFVFDAARGKKLPHLTTDAVNNHLKKLREGYDHKQSTMGFRNLATTNGVEILKVPIEVIDRQLAHKEKNKIIAAYDKSTLIEERTLFMERWGNLLLENGLII